MFGWRVGGFGRSVGGRRRRGRWSWCGVCNVFERGDELVEVVVDLAVVVGEAEPAVGFGGGDELFGLVALAAVDVEERWGGLEVGAGEAGVGVGAVLLWWASAVAVGQAGLNAGHVVFGPFGLGGGCVGVVGDAFSGEVDPLLAVLVEGCAHGGVMERRVAGGHLGAGVAEEPLDDVLGDACVDQPGAEGVAELVGGDPHGLAGVVAQVDVLLPAC